MKSIRVRKAELFAVSEEPGNPKGSEAQNLFENESPVEENDCGTVEVEVGEGLEVMGDHQDTEDEDSPNEEPETVAEAVMTEDTPQETNTASTYRTSEGKQLMASVDRLMSYCEGRHDASDAPCNGCRFENGAGGCRMGTKPCEWLIETESRKMGM